MRAELDQEDMYWPLSVALEKRRSTRSLLKSKGQDSEKMSYWTGDLKGDGDGKVRIGSSEHCTAVSMEWT